MKCIAKVGNDGKLSVDKVTDAIANKMNIIGNLSKASIGTKTLKQGNYFVSKEIYKEVNNLFTSKKTSTEEIKVGAAKPKKEHRKAKDIRADNGKGKKNV